MEDAAVYRHWTDAELELLADRSLAAADVAAATGRTEMAVRAARSRRGICRTRWTADELGRLRDYAASPKQIAAEIPSTASVPAVEPACAWVTDEKLPEPSGLTPKYAAASRHASVQTPIRASLQLRVSFWFMRRSSLSGMASPFDGKLIFQAIVSAGVVFWVCESPRFPNGKRGLTERRCYLRLSE